MCGPPARLPKSLKSTSSPLIVIVGPTGSGKSALALALAEALRGEIVNYDSVQLYRGLDIGSAKLPAAARRGIPHHLIDIADFHTDLTAGTYADLARPVLAGIASRDRVPILVGGTGFYLRALLDGLSPAPARDAQIRTRLTALRDRRPATLHRFLRRFDPVAAGRIHPNDHQKLIRAIELTVVARQPASVTQNHPRQPLQGFSVRKIGLSPDRPLLYAHLDARTECMFHTGLLDETSALLATGAPPDAKALQSLGYRQAVQFLLGQLPLAEAIRECQAKTRQYAKRQLTWFRAEPDVTWFSGFGTDPAVVAQAVSLCRPPELR